MKISTEYREGKVRLGELPYTPLCLACVERYVINDNRDIALKTFDLMVFLLHIVLANLNIAKKYRFPHIDVSI